MGALETVQRRKLSVDDFHRMGEVGILGEDDRVELIDGEMIEMAPIGSRHMAKVNRLSRMLGLAVQQAAIVSTQNPIGLPPRNEPQPDITLLKPRIDDYEAGTPGAADVLLVVEVADTTLAYDRDIKIPVVCTARNPGSLVVRYRGRRPHDSPRSRSQRISARFHAEEQRRGFTAAATARQGRSNRSLAVGRTASRRSSSAFNLPPSPAPAAQISRMPPA